MKLPPSKERSIALKLYAKIFSLRNNYKNDDKMAKEPLDQILWVIKKYDKALAKRIKRGFDKRDTR